jgi:hypothetical protein
VVERVGAHDGEHLGDLRLGRTDVAVQEGIVLLEGAKIGGDGGLRLAGHGFARKGRARAAGRVPESAVFNHSGCPLPNADFGKMSRAAAAA